MSPEYRTVARAAFLKAFAQTGIVLDGCQAAGVSRETVDGWRDDPYFLAAYRRAEHDANDQIRREIRRRAEVGVPRKRFTSRGQPILDPATGEQYVEHEYSDMLLKLRAQSRMAEFRPTLAVTTDVTETVDVLTPEERDAITAAYLGLASVQELVPVLGPGHAGYQGSPAPSIDREVASSSTEAAEYRQLAPDLDLDLEPPPADTGPLDDD